MKRSLFAALSVLVLSSQAFATSILDTRLAYREVPTRIGGTAQTLTHVFVYGSGEAVRMSCQGTGPGACRVTHLRNYTNGQLDQIDRLIAAARKGKIGRAPSTARCIVAPSKEAKLTADNDTVLLYKGDICTSILENKSPAAKQLVRMLGQLRGIQN